MCPRTESTPREPRRALASSWAMFFRGQRVANLQAQHQTSGYQIGQGNKCQTRRHPVRPHVEKPNQLWPENSSDLAHGIDQSKRRGGCRLAEDQRGHGPTNRLEAKIETAA